jgi:hypothetical protein
MLMKKKFVSNVLMLSVFIGLPQSGLSAVFEGVGYGTTQQEAHKLSLEDLSAQLYVKVESTFSKASDSTGASYASQKLIVSSHLPLMGVKTETKKTDSGDYQAQSILDASKSMDAYQEKLRSLSSEIATLKSTLDKQRGEAKEQTLNQLVTLLTEYEKFRLVARMLGVSNVAETIVTLSMLESERVKLIEEVDSLSMAANHLSKALKLERPYIHPFSPEHSDIPTQFGTAMRDALNISMKGVENPSEANTMIRGSYRIGKNFIEVVLVASEITTGKTLTTAAIKLLPKAYSGYRYESVESQFERDQKAGLIVDESGLRVALYTNKGARDLLFRDKETIRLVVRANRPAFYYIVGYVKNDKQQMSYLLELNPDATGGDKFVRALSAREVGREVVIGEFEVEPPFGFESYQLIASTKAFEKLPPTRLSDDGYYLIGDNILNAAHKTRAFKPKITEAQKSTETYLNLVTMPIKP